MPNLCSSVISFRDIRKVCGFPLHPVFLCHGSHHTCWTKGLEYPEDCWARQSRSMCETNRANNNRTFCTTGSAFKDASSKLTYLSCREDKLWGTRNPKRRYFLRSKSETVKTAKCKGSNVIGDLILKAVQNSLFKGPFTLTNVSYGEQHPLLFWLIYCNNLKKNILSILINDDEWWMVPHQ